MPHISTAERIGRTEEAQASILEFLEARMGNVPPEMAARLTQINDLDRLHRLRKLLFSDIQLADFEQAFNSI